MERALERERKGEGRVIPAILRPCDWHDLPFGKLLATPTDGRPVTMWPNIDQAFLDVVNAIKRALNELGQKAKPTRQTVPQPAADVPPSPTYDEPRPSNLTTTKPLTYTHQ